jgi:hypothetical protein
VPEDYGPLSDEVRVWRRVPWNKSVFKDVNGEILDPPKAQGNVYQGRLDEEHVSLGLADMYESPEQFLALEPLADERWGVLETSVGAIRNLKPDLDVIQDAPDHCKLAPPPGNSLSNRIRKTSFWALAPTAPK